jgi:glycosyltransferase involved in cell wall biosynthesis
MTNEALMKNRFSVIVPVEKLKPDLPVLESLQFLGLDQERDEVLVVEGFSPSKQRNEGVRVSRGEVLVFWDADCEIPKDYFHRIEKWFPVNGKTKAIVGGPVLLRDESSEMEKVFQAIFSNPWVMGRSAARYKSEGVDRESDQSELILCNLVMSRSVWDGVGEWNERLYPNEENEYLDRAEGLGIKMIHDPALSVKRPQRESYAHLFETFFRYGKGRGEQTVFSRKISWVNFIPSLVVPFFLITGSLISWEWAYQVVATGMGGYVLAVFATLFWGELKWQNAFFAAFISPFLLMNYGFGVWRGLVSGVMKSRRKGSSEVSAPVNVVKVFGAESEAD